MALNPTRIAASALVALATLAAGPLFAADGLAATHPTSIADKTLAGSVTERLGQSLGDSMKNVQVTASGGTVTLNGWVTSPRQEAQARKLASTVPGATQVYSRLRTWSSADLN